jgi:ribonuclease HI
MFYAVYKGRERGIFGSWDECKKRVDKYTGARYKKFKTRVDAQYYLDKGVTPNKSNAPGSRATSIVDFFGATPHPTSPGSPPINLEDEPLHVYTDGSCHNNGRANAKAGYGVYFGEDDPRNISKPLQGRQTNNRAEMTAIIEAMQSLEDDLQLGKRLVIHTDSEYSMKCCGELGRKHESRKWKTSDGRDIANPDLVKIGVALFRGYPSASLRYVKAHTGDCDRHSRGNEMADHLANVGAHQSTNKITAHFL